MSCSSDSGFNKIDDFSLVNKFSTWCNENDDDQTLNEKLLQSLENEELVAPALATIVTLCRTEGRERLDKVFVPKLLEFSFRWPLDEENRTICEAAVRALANICIDSEHKRSVAISWLEARAKQSTSPLFPDWWDLDNPDIKNLCYLWLVALLNICVDYEPAMKLFNNYNLFEKLNAVIMMKNPEKQGFFVAIRILIILIGSQEFDELYSATFFTKEYITSLICIASKGDSIFLSNIVVLLSQIVATFDKTDFSELPCAVDFSNILLIEIEKQCEKNFYSVDDILSPNLENVTQNVLAKSREKLDEYMRVLAALCRTDAKNLELVSKFSFLIPRLLSWIQIEIPEKRLPTPAHEVRLSWSCMIISNFFISDDFCSRYENNYNISTVIVALLERTSSSFVLFPALGVYKNLLFPLETRIILGLRFLDLGPQKLFEFMGSTVLADVFVIALNVFRIMATELNCALRIVDLILVTDVASGKGEVTIMGEVIRRYQEYHQLKKWLCPHVARLQNTLVETLHRGGCKEKIKNTGSLLCQWKILTDEDLVPFETRRESLATTRMILENGISDQFSPPSEGILAGLNPNDAFNEVEKIVK